jgi:hypothetical protein
MKKSALLLLALALSARADEQTFYYWNATNGGNWTATANWVMEDGSAATTYPHVAGDVAVFNGIGYKKTVYVNDGNVVDVDEVRMLDGCIRLSFRNSNTLHFHADRLVRSGCANFYLVTDGAYNHSSPKGVTIGNRNEVLFNGGFIPGATVCKDSGTWTPPQSATILEDESLKFASLDSAQMAYGISVDTTWTKNVTLLYGNYGEGRHISFNTECVLTVPSGQIAPMSLRCHVGNPSGQYQGTIDTAGSPLFFWPMLSSAPTCFRARLVNSPRFVQSGHGITLYCDDHSSETNEYDVASGKMMLGSVPPAGADPVTTNRCVLGTGPVTVSWAGTLDVAAGDALKNAELLRMTSYRGLGESWGRIHMSTNSVVDWFWLDDKLQKRGTHGATGSGAQYVDDAIFSGPGLLTVKKGSDGTMILIH